MPRCSSGIIIVTSVVSWPPWGGGGASKHARWFTFHLAFEPEACGRIDELLHLRSHIAHRVVTEGGHLILFKRRSPEGKCQRSLKTSHFLEQKTAPRNSPDAGPMEHVELPKSEPANNDLQFKRPRLVPTTDRTRAWDRSRDRRPVFAVSKTSHFDHRA